MPTVDRATSGDSSPDQSLNLSEHELVTAGELLAKFLCSFERSLGQRPVMPTLDRDQLSELFATPFSDQGIGVIRREQCRLVGRREPGVTVRRSRSCNASEPVGDRSGAAARR